MIVFLGICCVIALWYTLGGFGVIMSILLGLGSVALFLLILGFIAGVLHILDKGFNGGTDITYW